MWLTEVMSISEEQIRSTWNIASVADAPVWTEFTRLVNNLIAQNRTPRIANSDSADRDADLSDAEERAEDLSAVTTIDTVAAIEAIQRLAQGVIDQHPGEEDAQAAIMEDMAIAEDPIRLIQTLQQYVARLEERLSETRESYDAWRSSGLKMHRVLLELWHATSPEITEYRTFGDDPTVVQETVYAALRAPHPRRYACTVREILALGEKSIVQGRNGEVWQKFGHTWRTTEPQGFAIGSAAFLMNVAAPLTVLFDPTPRSYVPAGPLPERDADGVAGHDA